ncbi:MAG: hypothetical protein ACRC92_12705, partial [Peptostreptococcaceae bacterium]
VKNEENIKKKIDKTSDVCSINMSGDNIKYIEKIINRLNLSEDTNEVAGLYFELANNMKNNKDITIEDIQKTLDTGYEKRKEEVFGQNYYIYDFRMKDNDTYIEVDVDDDEVVRMGISIGISDYANYLIRISAANENLITQKKGFNLEMNMNSNLGYKIFDKSEEEIKEA